jgi:hypothetical protein
MREERWPLRVTSEIRPWLGWVLVSETTKFPPVVKTSL